MIGDVYRLGTRGWIIMAGKISKKIHFGICEYPAIILYRCPYNIYRSDNIYFPAGTLLPCDCIGNSSVAIMEKSLHKKFPKPVCKANKKYLRFLLPYSNIPYSNIPYDIDTGRKVSMYEI